LTVPASVQINGTSVSIYNIDGTFFATSDICTHSFALLSEGYLEGHMIECPLHGGQFDVRTGKGLCPPIVKDPQTFPVRVVHKEIQVDVTQKAACG
jgi:nitrite reductase/ring-hydroxylating ferredoxin subunit